MYDLVFHYKGNEFYTLRMLSFDIFVQIFKPKNFRIISWENWTQIQRLKIELSFAELQKLLQAGRK